ncbi:MAG TPA: ABC transporter substrate-binding protein, partial [Chloroflexota bacterium]
MRVRNRFAYVLAGLTILVLGCASPGAPGQSSSGSSGQPQPSSPKRLVAAVASTPYALNASLGAYLGSAPGMEAIGALVNSGFVIVDNEGNLQPLLAEEVPTVENGGWKLLPNGKMDIKWVIRDGAKWHDGTPVTSEDIAFTYQLAIDRDLAIFVQSQYRIIESLETPDSRTIIAHWARPFLYANLAFGYGNDNSNLPLPRHLLETAYKAGDSEAFLNLPYWTSAFVGTGPFRLKQWEEGTGVTVTANDAFVRGRPKIDEIEV